MSFCQLHLSRRLPVLSKSYNSSVRAQLQTRLLRNASTSATILHIRLKRSNPRTQRIDHITRRYVSSDTSTNPPTPSQHPQIVIEENSQPPLNDEEVTTPPSPPTNVSLRADTLPISCPGCGAYAQTIEPDEPGYYSRTRKKAKRLWHHRQQVIAKEQRTITSQDGESVDVETDATGKAETVIALYVSPLHSVFELKRSYRKHRR